jgi:hypothetical protein
LKLILYNDDNEVIEEVENIDNAKTIGFNEVSWDLGGMSGITQNFLIVEDGIKLEDVSEEEILNQFKYRAKLELALVYNESRIKILAEGNEIEKEKQFIETREKIDTLTSKEQMVYVIQQFKKDNI